jgi:hypothetical protein
MTVSGAYNRDYETLEAMQADWVAGKDFIIRSVDGWRWLGCYCSIRDFPDREIWGRYSRDGKLGLLQHSKRAAHFTTQMGDLERLLEDKS